MQKDGKISYVDLVWFLLSEEDKKTRGHDQVGVPPCGILHAPCDLCAVHVCHLVPHCGFLHVLCLWARMYVNPVPCL